jgi:hypothetical protein
MAEALAPPPIPVESKSRLRENLLIVFHGFIVAIGLLLSIAAYYLGLLFNFLFVLLVLLVCGVIISRISGLLFKTIEFNFIRHPFAPEYRRNLLQAINVWLFVGLTAWTLELAVIPAQFSAEDFNKVQVWIWLCTLFLLMASLLPQKRVHVSVNVFFAIGWLFLAVQLIRLFMPVSRSDAIVLSPPFRGEWYVYHGGRSVLFNHHYRAPSQRDALDIASTVDGREVQGSKQALTSYPAFGKPLYAPIGGRIVRALNNRPDMPIGQVDRQEIAGNHIVIDAGEGRFVLLAHLKKGSVRVAVGDTIKAGDPVAECGNSGNTSAPHLHLQVQSGPDIQAPNVRTFPIVFRDVTVVRRGKTRHLEKAELRRNDRLLVP